MSVFVDIAPDESHVDSLPVTAPAGKWRGRLTRAALPVLSLIVFFIVWQLAAASGIWNQTFVPYPSTVWRAFLDVSTTHDGVRGYAGYLLTEHLCIGLLFAIISYVGFEATAIFRDEARTPERTIPRATYVALILIGVFYAVTSWALISGWGDEEAVRRATESGGTFLGDTAQRYVGVVGADIITVLYFTSLFACILSFHNVVSRYVFALSQRDVLPASLSRPHDKHGSPHQASLWISGAVAVSIILAVVFKLDPAAQFYTWFAGATTVGIVVLLLATSVAVLVYFARDRKGHSQWRVRIGPALGVLGLLGSLILILANLKDLVGGSSILAWVIVGLLVAAFAVGAVVGTRVRDDTVVQS